MRSRARWEADGDALDSRTIPTEVGHSTFGLREVLWNFGNRRLIDGRQSRMLGEQSEIDDREERFRHLDWHRRHGGRDLVRAQKAAMAIVAAVAGAPIVAVWAALCEVVVVLEHLDETELPTPAGHEGVGREHEQPPGSSRFGSARGSHRPESTGKPRRPPPANPIATALRRGSSDRASKNACARRPSVSLLRRR